MTRAFRAGDDDLPVCQQKDGAKMMEWQDAINRTMNTRLLGDKKVRKSGSVHLVIGHHDTGKLSGKIAVGFVHLTFVFTSLDIV